MCLRTVTKKCHKPNDRVRIGYKVFAHNAYVTKKPRAFYGIHYGRSCGYKLGKHYKATDGKISYRRQGRFTARGKYDEGFHVYAHLEEARTMCWSHTYEVIVEVIAWDIRAYGTDGTKDAFVAKNIRPMRIVR